MCRISFGYIAVMIVIGPSIFAACSIASNVFRTSPICPPKLNGKSHSSGGSNSNKQDLLMGYDLLSNLFNGESSLWVVPIARRLTFGHQLQPVTKTILQKLSTSGAKRRRQLKKLRRLSPSVSDKFVDLHPNPLAESIGKNLAWKAMADLSDRSVKGELNFELVHLTSIRLVALTAASLLEFECNEDRRAWLQDVAEEYDSYRDEIRDLLLEYIMGERVVI